MATCYFGEKCLDLSGNPFSPFSFCVAPMWTTFFFHTDSWREMVAIRILATSKCPDFSPVSSKFHINFIIILHFTLSYCDIWTDGQVVKLLFCPIH